MHKEHKLFYWLLGGVAVLGIMLWVGSLLFYSKEDRGYEMNLYTEAVGVIVSIGFTILVINQVYDKREKDRLKRRLVREAASRSNDIALNAVGLLGDEGWLIGAEGVLQGADLSKADLKGDVDLRSANLRCSNLSQAILTGAKLNGADLERANLFWAKLPNAHLDRANLRGTDLTSTYLVGATFFGANLEGAYMFEANTNGAFFRFMDILGLSKRTGYSAAHPPTIMPDGKQYSSDIDMKRYTDEDHGEFKQTLRDINRIRTKMGLYTVNPEVKMSDLFNSNS